MTFYLTIFFIIAFLTVIEEFTLNKYRKYVDSVMLIVLCSVSAMHGIGGDDWHIYYANYNRMPDFWSYISDPGSYKSYLFNFEFGYNLIVSIIKSLGFSFGGYLVLEAIFFYMLMYIGLRRYTRHWGIVMLIFLYKMFAYDTFISMRQSLTIAIFFVAIKYIYERKPIKYYILIFIAVTIHNGSFLLIPLYFINRIRLSKNWIVVLLCVFFVSAVFANFGMGYAINRIMSIINNDKTEYYYSNASTLNIFYTLEYYLLMILVVLNYKKINHLKYGTLIINLLLLVLPFVTLFSDVAILRRELDYFFPFYGIMIGYLYDVQSKFRALIVSITMILSLYGYIRYLNNFDEGGLIPYKTWVETL